MGNAVIEEYLRSYQGSYPLPDLQREILSKGYTQEEFDSALRSLSSSQSSRVSKSDSSISPSGTSSTIPSVHKLPTTMTVSSKKSFGVLQWSLLFILLLLLGCVAIVVLNYFEFDLFGFNVFNWFS